MEVVTAQGPRTNVCCWNMQKVQHLPVENIELLSRGMAAVWCYQTSWAVVRG
jgi:hypothetical protein